MVKREHERTPTLYSKDLLEQSFFWSVWRSQTAIRLGCENRDCSMSPEDRPNVVEPVSGNTSRIGKERNGPLSFRQ